MEYSANSPPQHILSPVPYRAFGPSYSPFSPSWAPFSPLQQLSYSKLMAFPSSSPFPLALSPSTEALESARKLPISKAIQKLNFSEIRDSTRLRVNNVCIEISLSATDDIEATSLLTSLSQRLPLKRSPPSSPPHTRQTTCKCSKSQCLKLYCDCLASGFFCVGCNCVGCLNTEENAQQRAQAMERISTRDSRAFKPKGRLVKTEGSVQTIHNRGCNCAKSKCSKKYCECFGIGAKCSSKCNCVGCRNSG